MTLYIAPIVEGQTEQRCLERLIHRVWGELLVQHERLQVIEPFRGKRDSLIQKNGEELSKKVQQAFLKLQPKIRKDRDARHVVLILVDAEGDCPATLAPQLLDTAQQAQGNADIVCVIAKRMIENWIVAGATKLAGVGGMPDKLESPKNPEDCNGSAWLNQQLRSVKKNRSYSKTVDAIEFVKAMDLNECRSTSPSFDKLCRELERRLAFASIDDVDKTTTD